MQTDDERPRTVSRSTFLKAAAGAFGGASLLGKAAVPASANAIQVTKIADLTGPGLTTLPLTR